MLGQLEKLSHALMNAWLVSRHGLPRLSAFLQLFFLECHPGLLWMLKCQQRYAPSSCCCSYRQLSTSATESTIPTSLEHSSHHAVLLYAILVEWHDYLNAVVGSTADSSRTDSFSDHLSCVGTVHHVSLNGRMSISLLFLRTFSETSSASHLLTHLSPSFPRSSMSSCSPSCSTGRSTSSPSSSPATRQVHPQPSATVAET